MTTEPHLQPLSGETLSHRSEITEDGARLDIVMYGFWGGGVEKAFVDVSVFNRSAQSNRKSPLSSKSMSKKREGSTISECVRSNIQHLHHWCYPQRVEWVVPQRHFTNDSHLWWLKKRNVPYAVTLNWIRCQLTFALLRASTYHVY